MNVGPWQRALALKQTLRAPFQIDSNIHRLRRNLRHSILLAQRLPTNRHHVPNFERRATSELILLLAPQYLSQRPVASRQTAPRRFSLLIKQPSARPLVWELRRERLATRNIPGSARLGMRGARYLALHWNARGESPETARKKKPSGTRFSEEERGKRENRALSPDHAAVDRRSRNKAERPPISAVGARTCRAGNEDVCGGLGDSATASAGRGLLLPTSSRCSHLPTHLHNLGLQLQIALVCVCPPREESDCVTVTSSHVVRV